jgi:hypothetical protein
MLMTVSHVTFAAHLILEDFGTILLQTLQPGISMGQVQIFGQASFGPLYIATVIDTTWYNHRVCTEFWRHHTGPALCVPFGLLMTWGPCCTHHAAMGFERRQHVLGLCVVCEDAWS